MAVRTREEILESVRTMMGDSTDDNSLGFLEDISDTLDDYETRVQGDGIDWKQKYEENDANWRKTYKERFFGKQEDVPPVDDHNDTPEEKTRFEDLFEVKE